MKNLFDTATDHYGHADMLDNAGIMIFGILKDTTDEDFDRQFNINVKYRTVYQWQVSGGD